MPVSLRLILTIVALAITSSAQIKPFVPCNVDKVVSLGHANGVAFKRVIFVEPSREVGASVFVPDSPTPVPGIVFAYSSIHGPTKNTNLLRFALALARAGAASIVLDGAIDWETPNDNARRPPHEMACAGQWLMVNEKLDDKRLAIAGPPIGGWGSGDTPFCLPAERPCWIPHVAATFGQTSQVEWENTYSLLTLRGCVHTARFFQQALGLAEVKREWLADPPK